MLAAPWSLRALLAYNCTKGRVTRQRARYRYIHAAGSIPPGATRVRGPSRIGGLFLAEYTPTPHLPTYPKPLTHRKVRTYLPIHAGQHQPVSCEFTPPPFSANFGRIPSFLGPVSAAKRPRKKIASFSGGAVRFPRDPWQFVRPHVQQHVLEVGALPAVPREGAGGRDRGGAPRGSLIWVRTFARYVT